MKKCIIIKIFIIFVDNFGVLDYNDIVWIFVPIIKLMEKFYHERAVSVVFLPPEKSVYYDKKRSKRSGFLFVV